jgi:RNA polymerase sigma-70 factor (ECF subfamily)
VAPSTDQVNSVLERYQAYLETLTFIQIDPRLRGKVGRSDIIQKTLIEAWQTQGGIEAMEPQDQKRWLRRMLLNNLKEEVDRFIATQMRDVRREKSLEDAARESSIRLGERIAAEESTPSEKLIKIEQQLHLEEALEEALAQLPERQRKAVILKQYHGWKLREIAEHLKCTTNAAAGLHAHGLANLRKLLGDWE